MTDLAHATPCPSPVLAQLAEVSAREGLGSLAARLFGLRAWMADDLAALEADLGGAATGGHDLARRAAAHLLACPGKRIRPLCVLLAARAGGPHDVAEAREIAAAAELVHAATLLHDDVIDLGTERRGAPTARLLFGNPASVLGGDHLLVEALQRVSSTGRSELLAGLLDTIGEMVEAESLQLALKGRLSTEPSTWHQVMEGKTAALFAWSLRAGGTVGGLEPRALEALELAGRRLGHAFQLVDDALDLEGDRAHMGKDSLRDLEEGKPTWPLCLAVQRDPSLRSLLERAASCEPDLDLEALRQRLLATGCATATRERARRVALRARTLLFSLPEGPAREALLAVVEQAVERAR